MNVIASGFGRNAAAGVLAPPGAKTTETARLLWLNPSTSTASVSGLTERMPAAVNVPVLHETDAMLARSSEEPTFWLTLTVWAGPVAGGGEVVPPPLLLPPLLPLAPRSRPPPRSRPTSRRRSCP